MKKLIVLLTICTISTFGIHVLAQEFSEDDESTEPVDISVQVLGENELSEGQLEAINSAYVIIYNRKNFGGYSKKIWLKDGSWIDLHQCNRLHDNVRSMKIFGDRHITVTLLEKALVTYANQKMAVWWTYGSSVERGVNKRDLNGYKMFRQASAMRIHYDGFRWGNNVQYVSC